MAADSDDIARNAWLYVFKSRKFTVGHGDDLEKVLQQAGSNPTKKTIKSLMVVHKGCVTYHNFKAIVRSQYAGRTSTAVVDQARESLLKAFKKLDVNGDGYLSRAELTRMLTKQGEQMSEAEVSAVFTMADRNGDGRLDFEEFAATFATTTRECQRAARRRQDERGGRRDKRVEQQRQQEAARKREEEEAQRRLLSELERQRRDVAAERERMDDERRNLRDEIHGLSAKMAVFEHEQERRRAQTQIESVEAPREAVLSSPTSSLHDRVDVGEEPMPSANVEHLEEPPCLPHSSHEPEAASPSLTPSRSPSPPPERAERQTSSPASTTDAVPAMDRQMDILGSSASASKVSLSGVEPGDGVPAAAEDPQPDVTTTEVPDEPAKTYEGAGATPDTALQGDDDGDDITDEIGEDSTVGAALEDISFSQARNHDADDDDAAAAAGVATTTTSSAAERQPYTPSGSAPALPPAAEAATTPRPEPPATDEPGEEQGISPAHPSATSPDSGTTSSAEKPAEQDPNKEEEDKPVEEDSLQEAPTPADDGAPGVASGESERADEAEPAAAATPAEVVSVAEHAADQQDSEGEVVEDLVSQLQDKLAGNSEDGSAQASKSPSQSSSATNLIPPDDEASPAKEGSAESPPSPEQENDSERKDSVPGHGGDGVEDNEEAEGSSGVRMRALPASESPSAPDLKDWHCVTFKGCIFANDSSVVCTHQYVLTITKTTKLFATLRLKGPTKPIDVGIALARLKESGGDGGDGSVNSSPVVLEAVVSDGVKDGAVCLVAELDPGDYIFSPFTSCAQLASVFASEDRVSVAEDATDSNGDLMSGDERLLPATKAAFEEIFHRHDLNGSGGLDRNEYAYFHDRCGEEELGDDDWQVIEDSFSTNPAGELSLSGFLQLQGAILRDAADNKHLESWRILDAMGYNRKLQLVEAWPFAGEVNMSNDDEAEVGIYELTPDPTVADESLHLAADKLGAVVEVTGGGDDAVVSAVRARSLRWGVEFCTTVVAWNKSGESVTLVCDCSESVNVVSHRHANSTSDVLVAGEKKILHHLVPVDESATTSAVCRISAKSD